MRKNIITKKGSLFSRLSKAIVCLVLSYLLVASPYLTLCAYSLSKENSATKIGTEMALEQNLNVEQQATEKNALIGNNQGADKLSFDGSGLSPQPQAVPDVTQLSVDEVLKNIFMHLDESDVSLNDDETDDAEEISNLALEAYKQKASQIVSTTLNPNKQPGESGYVVYDYSSLTTKSDVASKVRDDIRAWAEDRIDEMGADESLLTMSTSTTGTILPVLKNIFGNSYNSVITAESRAGVIASLQSYYGSSVQFKNQTRATWTSQFNGKGNWSNYTSTPTGDGSQENPYIVKSAGNWAWFVKNRNTMNPRDDVYIEFQNDAGYIDFSAHQLDDFYIDTNYHINGNNVALCNIYIANNNYGFFNINAYRNLNLTLENFVVASCSLYKAYDEGSFFGYSRDSSSSEKTNITMENCIINCDIEDYSPGDKESGLGGIINGTQNGDSLNFKNVINLTNISTDVISDYTEKTGVGGFVGTVEEGSKVSFENCLNFGSVTGKDNVGGFVGYVGSNFGGNNKEDASDAIFSMKNCVNYGDVTNNTTNGEIATGGLVGKLTKDISSLAFEGNINKANVKSDYGRVGGLIGYIGKNNTLTVKNSSNFGYVGSINVKYAYNGAFGGIVGYATSYVTLGFENIYNFGTVVSNTYTDVKVGGVIGYVGSYGMLTMKNVLCDDSDIEGQGACLGGLVGYLASSAQIESVEVLAGINNYTSGADTQYARNSLGGFIGEINNKNNTAGIEISIINGKMNGSIEHSEEDESMFVGGIVGYVHGANTVTLNIEKTCALNNIDACGNHQDLYLGGFVGYAGAIVNISECISNADQGDIDATNDGAQDVNAGGFVGYVGGLDAYYECKEAKLTISNSVNLSNVYSANRTSGFVAHADTETKVNIYNSINSCELYGSDFENSPLPGTAGFVAYANERSEIVIDGVLSTGYFEPGANNNSGSYYHQWLRGNAGGIVGYVATDAVLTVNNAINSANIESYGAGIGGILGQSTTDSIVSISDVINTVGLYNLNTEDVQSDIGGIAGRLGAIKNEEILSDKKALISNAINLGTIHGSQYVGGLVGTNVGDLQIENSLNAGQVTIESDDSYYCEGFGGIIGRTYLEIQAEINSTINVGEVYAGRYVGGFIGFVEAGSGAYRGEDNYTLSIYINNSHNFGEVSAENIIGDDPYGVGGFIGYWEDRLLENPSYYNFTNIIFEGLKMNFCSNNAQVSGFYEIGGFVGTIYEQVQFYGCVNNGAVLPIDDDERVGGFVGHLSNPSVVNDGYLIYDYLKWGYNDFDRTYLITFANCQNNGEVNAQYYSSGFVGELQIYNTPYNTQISFENSTNNGSVLGEKCSGGFVGYLNVSMPNGYSESYQGYNILEFMQTRTASLSFNNSTNNGVIGDNKGYYCGGFIGELNDFTLNGTIAFENSTNNGNILAGSESGGFIGDLNIANDEVQVEFTAKNCVNNGDILLRNSASGGLVGYWESGENYEATNITVEVDGFVNNGDIATGYIDEDGNHNWNDGAGGVFGYGYFDGFITIKNCINNGSINGGWASGGIAGYLSPDNSALFTIENCVNNGTICSLPELGWSDAHAGIVGAIYRAREGSVIRNCVNNGDVYGAWENGGIVGETYNVHCLITNNINNAVVTSLGRSGTIIGEIAYGNYISLDENVKVVGNLSTNIVISEGYESAEVIGAVTSADNFILINNHVIFENDLEDEIIVQTWDVYNGKFAVEVNAKNADFSRMYITDIIDANGNGVGEESEWRGPVDQLLANFKNNKKLSAEQFFEVDGDEFVNLDSTSFDGEDFNGVLSWKVGYGNNPYVLESKTLKNKHFIRFDLSDATIENAETNVQAQMAETDLTEIVLPNEGIKQGVKEIIGWAINKERLVYFEQPESGKTTLKEIKEFFEIPSIDEAVLTLYPVFDSSSFEVAWEGTDANRSEEMLMVDGEIYGQTYFRGSQNPKLVSTVADGISAEFNGFYVFDNENSSWVYIAKPEESANGSFEFELNGWLNGETIKFAQETEAGFKFTFKSAYNNTTFNVSLQLPTGGFVSTTGGDAITESEDIAISEGSSISVSAQAKEGYKFVKFEVYEGGALTPTEYTSETVSFTVSSTLSVEAIFEPIQYEIVVEKVDADGNLVNVGTLNNYGENMVVIGENVGRFVARESASSASTRYVFDRWSIGTSSRAIELDTTLNVTSNESASFRYLAFDGTTYSWFVNGNKVELAHVSGTSYRADVEMYVNYYTAKIIDNSWYWGNYSFVDLNNNKYFNPEVDIELANWAGGDLNQLHIKTSEDGTYQWFNGARWVDLEETETNYKYVAKVNFIIEDGVRYYIDQNNNGMFDSGDNLELDSFILTKDIINNYSNSNNQIIIRGVFNKQFYFTMQNTTPTFGAYELTYLDEIGNTQTIASNNSSLNKIWLDEGKTVNVSLNANMGYQVESVQNLEQASNGEYFAKLTESKQLVVGFKPIDVAVEVVYKNTEDELIDASVNIIGYNVYNKESNLIGENGTVQASNIIEFKVDEFREIANHKINRFLIERVDGTGFDDISYNELEFLSAQVSIDENFFNNYYFADENCFKIKAEFIEIYVIGLSIAQNNNDGVDVIVEIENDLGEFEEVDFKNSFELKRNQKIKITATVKKYYDFEGFTIAQQGEDLIETSESVVEHQATSSANIEVVVLKQVLALNSKLVGEYKGELEALPETVKIGDEIIFEFNPDTNYEILNWKIGGTRVLDLDNAVVSGNSVKLTITEDFLDTFVKNNSVVFETDIQTMMNRTVFYSIVFIPLAILILFLVILTILIVNARNKKIRIAIEKRIKDAETRFNFTSLVSDLKSGNAQKK